MSPAEGAPLSARLDVVICTFNNAAGLAQALDHLARQEGAAAVDWRVTVVDNASTDDTPAVVERARAAFPVPLRIVREPRQGLTWARLRGVRETDGAWIAFVDDDNLLDRRWIAAVALTITERPLAGGVGGRVLLRWDRPPPQSALDFGFCFAEQDLGVAPRAVESLVGAGMVLRREALAACGWLDEPLLADRIGRSLISGGDVEIALRVRAAGYELWYAPEARMEHRQSAGRSTRRYLLRIARALGATAAPVSLLGWAGDYPTWRAAQRAVTAAQLRQAWRGLAWSLIHRRRLTAAAGWLSLALGHWFAVRSVERMPGPQRDRLMGKAAAPGRGRGDVAPQAAAQVS